jgi:competence protein ComEA
MKLRFFGKEAEIKKEAVIIAVSVLALLGVLVGYAFFRDTSDIIIEAGAEHQDVKGDGSIQVSGIDTVEMSGNSGLSLQQGQNDSTGSNQTANISGTTLSAAGNGAGQGKLQDAINTRNGASDADKNKIKIYVVGCVNKPGIVTLDKGQLVCDAVKEAGGLTEEADEENINMVYSLNENVMLYIKSKKDDNSVGNGAVIVRDSGSGADVMGKGDDTAEGKDQVVVVNINTAGIDELDTLPGIGEATAKDIIAFRDKYGGFDVIEDIMRVPRIKENRFESIKEYITVG